MIETAFARRRAALAFLSLFALASGALFVRDARAADASVSISNFAFVPASVTVNVGDTVTWTNNQGGVPHTVSSDTGAFDSGTLNGGGTFAQTFGTAGTFAYHCNIHPSMTGSVVVTGAAATATTAAPTATTAAPAPTTAAPTATTAAATATTAATQPAATATSGAIPATAQAGVATTAASATPSPAPPATGNDDG